VRASKGSSLRKFTDRPARQSGYNSTLPGGVGAAAGFRMEKKDMVEKRRALEELDARESRPPVMAHVESGRRTTSDIAFDVDEMKPSEWRGAC